jgi:5-methyltetrahydrofolate--homocysteine methyltransferase
MNEYQLLQQAVMDGENEQALVVAQQLLAAGQPPLQIIDRGLIAAMAQVGDLFRAGELFVPEVMMAAETVATVIEQLKPLLHGEMIDRGCVVIGTVKGDLHDIGKNLVALLLSSNGFRVVDLGKDVAAEDFLAAATEHRADVVGLSALLTTTMSYMRTVVEEFTAAGLREKVRIVIGGAPVTSDYAAEIGADGYSEDAAAAVILCRQLMEGKS